MTAVIVEDDDDSQEVLRLLLTRDFPQIQLLGQFYTAQEGLEGIRRIKPALVFLDIALPDKSGFDLLRELNQIDFDIIFVSGYNEFAAQAFRWSALDFLLKPVTASLLREAIDKAESRRNPHNTNEQLRLLLENMSSLQRSKPLSKLALPTASDIEFVNISDVIRVEGDKNYSTFVLNDKRKITVSRTLGEYEKMLERTTFMRIHKSHLANLIYVKKYMKADGGWVLTADGAELPVSPAKRKDLLEQLSLGLDDLPSSLS
jgi:two-component system, LytTR family, response regulator